MHYAVCGGEIALYQVWSGGGGQTTVFEMGPTSLAPEIVEGHW